MRKPSELIKVAVGLNDLRGKATVRLEPRKFLDEAIVKLKHDGEGCHLVYSYYRLAQAYQKDFGGCEYEEALEFVDYNTVRALPYMAGEKYAAPVITYARRYERLTP